ncbi:MAG: hypothetical protein WBD36_10070 [Bacteroidota bacterium]
MKARTRPFLIIGITALLCAVCWGATIPQPPLSPDRPLFNKQIISLKDFTEQEVRAVGLKLDKELTIHISAVGGGEKTFWREFFGDDERESGQMFAAGWIINADTREPVWEMTMDNTSGKTDHRTCDEDLTLKKGSYEVYFAAYGFVHKNGFSVNSMNIDRRKEHRTTRRVVGKLLQFFDGSNDEWYNDFMDLAKDTWGISVTIPDQDGSFAGTFDAPLKKEGVLLQATSLGDGAVYTKGLSVSKDATLHIYAIGEAQRKDQVYDYGWIVNADTRERVWEMTLRNISWAGGADKNRKYEGDVKLPKGNYEVYFVTDDSHSIDDWNARPPFDPFNYGVTISAARTGDRGDVKVVEPFDVEKNVIVKLTEVRNDDFKSAGFSLKTDTKLHIYALGEADGNNEELADHGWIVNAKTHDRVWTMERSNTYHAGGDSKNRLADEVISLPKGDYLAYYETDGSHAYNDWNASEPFDPEHWGITIMGAGEGFNPKNVAKYSEENEQGVLVQLVRVKDDRHMRERFTVDKPTKVRIYAIGEGRDGEMYDYGWIEDVKNGETVWEMTYKMTTNAGGARKNRLVDRMVTLEKGEYELHYKTDDTHSFNDWNDDPPEDRTHWGITLYKEE